MFITINDKGHVFDVLSNWPVDDVKVNILNFSKNIQQFTNHFLCRLLL